MQSFLESHSKG